MRTAVGFTAAGATFIAILALSEKVSRRWMLRAETGRKLAHISSGILAAVLPFFLPFPAIAGLGVAFVPFMVASRRLKLFPILQQAERSTLGEVYFPVGVVLAAVFVPKTPAYVFGILVMGLGDAFASLVGERFGRRIYRLTAKKSYVGSATMFVTVSVIGFAVLASIGRLTPRTSAGMALVACALAVEEGVVGGGADNLVLPVTAALLFRLLV